MSIINQILRSESAAVTSPVPSLCAGMPFGDRARANVYEDNEGFTIEFLVAGVSREDINLSIEKNSLFLNVAKDSIDSEEKNEIRREFMVNQYHREFKLPTSANLKKISANSRDGILTVSVPKNKKEASKIKVEVG